MSNKKEYWIHKSILKEDNELPLKTNHINVNEHIEDLVDTNISNINSHNNLQDQIDNIPLDLFVKKTTSDYNVQRIFLNLNTNKVSEIYIYGNCSEIYDNKEIRLYTVNTNRNIVTSYLDVKLSFITLNNTVFNDYSLKTSVFSITKLDNTLLTESDINNLDIISYKPVPTGYTFAYWNFGMFPRVNDIYTSPEHYNLPNTLKTKLISDFDENINLSFQDGGGEIFPNENIIQTTNIPGVLNSEYLHTKKLIALTEGLQETDDKKFYNDDRASINYEIFNIGNNTEVVRNDEYVNQSALKFSDNLIEKGEWDDINKKWNFKTSKENSIAVVTSTNDIIKKRFNFNSTRLTPSTLNIVIVGYDAAGHDLTLKNNILSIFPTANVIFYDFFNNDLSTFPSNTSIIVDGNNALFNFKWNMWFNEKIKTENILWVSPVGSNSFLNRTDEIYINLENVCLTASTGADGLTNSTAYAEGLNFIDLGSSPNAQSWSAGVIAGKIAKINNDTNYNFTWGEIITACRLTASYADNYTIENGFGVIDVDAAIAYLENSNSNNKLNIYESDGSLVSDRLVNLNNFSLAIKDLSSTEWLKIKDGNGDYTLNIGPTYTNGNEFGNTYFNKYGLEGYYSADNRYDTSLTVNNNNLYFSTNDNVLNTNGEYQFITYGNLPQERVLWKWNNGVISKEFVIHDEYLKYDIYGQGNIIETPTYYLGLDNTGKFVEIPLNRTTGWMVYTDSLYTEASPLVINSGTTSILTNNANSVIDSQKPYGVTELWDNVNNKILSAGVNDTYSIEMRFKAKTNNNNGYFNINIDIGGAVGIISEETKHFPRGANVEQSFKIIFNYFTLSTFVANGGIINIESITGDLSIYNIQFLINRTHKGI